MCLQLIQFRISLQQLSSPGTQIRDSSQCYADVNLETDTYLPEEPGAKNAAEHQTVPKSPIREFIHKVALQ